MFKVHFQLKGEEYELVAGDLDLSHPYFVSIKELDLDYEEGFVVNPHLENTKKRFQNTDNIMIPLQNVALIESVPVREKKKKPEGGGPRVVPLRGLEETENKTPEA
ncbi:MAG: DUF1820 family protein [Acidobacteriota bacterium]|nr:DUF1820 family protein [Acidobacteriota bacterium]